MSTHDVPGANPSNGDELKVGCWAEHDDGSLIYVEGAEDNRVIYSIFDMSKEPVIEYRDAMPKTDFEKTFTGRGNVKWVWHDKTPFPWSKVIKAGASNGVRWPSAHDQLTAAERVAQSLTLKAKKFNPSDNNHLLSREVNKIKKKLQKVIDKLGV